MAEQNEAKFLITEPMSRHFIDGQAFSLDRVIGTNMCEGEIKEVVGNASGVDPDMVEVSYSNKPLKSQAGRLAVALSSARWNSSWDPRKGDPSLN